MTEQRQEGTLPGGRDMYLDLNGGHTVYIQRSTDLDI